MSVYPVTESEIKASVLMKLFRFESKHHEFSSHSQCPRSVAVLEVTVLIRLMGVPIAALSNGIRRIGNLNGLGGVLTEGGLGNIWTFTRRCTGSGEIEFGTVAKNMLILMLPDVS